MQGGSPLSLMRHVAKLAVLQLLRGYKWAISPMFPPACRYVPTCSEYAMEAVERYGAVRGGLRGFVAVVALPSFCGWGIRSGGEGQGKSRLLAKDARNGAPDGALRKR